MNDTSSGIWLTPDGYAALREELDHLTSVKRLEIADRIRSSQEHGEFSEDNNELDEIKFEQAIVEQRISELKSIFGTAQIIESENVPTDHIGVGSIVTLEDSEFGEKFQIQVVSTIEANPEKDRVSNESPLGDALMGASVADVVTVDAPDGARKYKVLSIGR